MAGDLDALRTQRDVMAGLADLVELRLDGLARPDVAGALAGRRGPVVVTCRPGWEGGKFTGTEEERHGILAAALDAGAEYVDIEWRAGFDDLIHRSRGRGIVLSTHEFTGVPADIGERLRVMSRTGVDVIKAAVTVSRLADLGPLARLGREHLGRRRGVLIGMGTSGLVTRLLPDRFGSCWSYGGDGVAPGQVGVERMVGEFRFREATAATPLYGVAGRPVGHSLSPAMHNAAFGAAGLDAVYVPLEAVDADDLAAFVDAFAVRGVSITAPFKVDVMRKLGTIDVLTRRVGAANTIRVCGSTWSGRNTDVEGFLAPLVGRMNLGGARCSLLGAGGAARAVAMALSSQGAEVTVYARDRARAEAVAAMVDGRVAALPPPAHSWDLLVNATPVGMAPRMDETPVDAALLSGGGLVYDLVYRPMRTRLLREAASAGCGTIGGLDMLVAQAERQFTWWTGQPAPEGVMEQAARTGIAAAGDGTDGQDL